MKYEPNSWLLIIFNKYGSKKMITAHKSYLAAKYSSDGYLEKHKKSSTVISRVMYNSKKSNLNKWSYNK